MLKELENKTESQFYVTQLNAAKITAQEFQIQLNTQKINQKIDFE